MLILSLYVPQHMSLAYVVELKTQATSRQYLNKSLVFLILFFSHHYVRFLLFAYPFDVIKFKDISVK
ncbi:hypothetical protein KDD93_07815 [Campylobacter sp. faydin G-24]|uniref:Uncharacterized protein n=1 Tax=Campylobacter anatolicus TaxID=2829105 RepID=A0ABS5HJM8_9BACT|nr:hypothetical protein [Campylobacter anatolicus]MBR8464468.1 hypothetical protein [Campylobacter anatolicus]